MKVETGVQPSKEWCILSVDGCKVAWLPEGVEGSITEVCSALEGWWKWFRPLPASSSYLKGNRVFRLLS